MQDILRFMVFEDMPRLLRCRKKASIPSEERGFSFMKSKSCSKSAEYAFRVFDSSDTIVIGPTPPGTGVINEAFSLTESKSTSPQSPAH